MKDNKYPFPPLTPPRDFLRNISKSPWYDDRADFNTNAKGYYDYLARFNKYLHCLEDIINRLLARNIKVNDTDTIDLTKIGDWIDNGKCPISWDDIIELQGEVKIATGYAEEWISEIDNSTYFLDNSISVIKTIPFEKRGIYSRDFSEIIKNIEKKIKDILSRLDKIESDIKDIQKEISKINTTINNIIKDINNIYEMINAINGGGNYKTLTKGKDYDLTFFSGFYTETTDLIIGAIDLSDRTLIRISGSKGGGTVFMHDNLADVRIRHTSTVEEEPKSRMVGIKFKGDYAKLNNGSFINTVIGNTGLWNVRSQTVSNKNLRASFPAIVNQHYNHSGFTLLLTITTYQDGYNSQFTTYEVDDIYTEHINLTATNTIIWG